MTTNWHPGLPCPKCGGGHFCNPSAKKPTFQIGQLSQCDSSPGVLSCNSCGWKQGDPIDDEQGGKEEGIT